jgi:Mn-dependent DtxR family transcriptional regulator
MPPPPVAAAPFLEPTRQEKILALVADAAKAQRGISTAEVSAKLGINRQQVQTAIIPLERDGKIITVRGKYEKTDKGPRRSNSDYIYSASVLDGWT